ncbi:MAG: ATP-binding protein [Polyangiaceae bacterium]|nr:ATP-binding protein [Polyangiaceae bacterium]
MKLKFVGHIARIRYRLALALVLAALLPVLVAIGLVETTVRQTSARFFVPEVGEHLDQSLSVYQELARSIKESMQNAATAIAANHELREAAQKKDAPLVRNVLKAEFGAFPRLVELSILDAESHVLGHVARPTPLDPLRENALTVVRSLARTSGIAGDNPPVATPGNGSPTAASPDDDALTEEEPSGDDAVTESRNEGLRLVAVFSADKAQFDAFQNMGRFVETYHKIERRRGLDDQSYVYAFATLLGLTIVAAVGVGVLLARGVTGRVSALAAATSAAAGGDLSVRVRETGQDEITDLAKAFNRMLAEIETSRARIEYLQRMEAWQEMARRLAHEIKNPLTPIQLAAQEIHRRYDGGDAGYKQLLDTTLEIVEDEVGTLRRLVSEFSNFARLPQAELEPADLRGFLQEQEQKLTLERASGGEIAGSLPPTDVDMSFELPNDPAPLWLDRQMFRRAFLNLIENATHALRQSAAPRKLKVRLQRDADFWLLSVEDNGPGIPEALRVSLFDPYVTTKSYGVGLGLAIVKKIVIDHGGRIAAGTSSLGGAKVLVWLPAEGTHAQLSFLSSRKSPSAPSHPQVTDTPFDKTAGFS